MFRKAAATNSIFIRRKYLRKAKATNVLSFTKETLMCVTEFIVCKPIK